MLRIIGATDKGMCREINEDRFTGEVFGEKLGYAVVCDGMGGKNGGNVASSIASEEVRRLIESSLRPDASAKTIYMIMQTALENANTMVYEKASMNEELSGMGTTVCLAVVSSSTAYIGNIGDSRCYLLRNGELTKLTTDHTLVQNMLQEGIISEEEAKNHPSRHYITKAAGVCKYTAPDFYEKELLPGDALLLCSDGFYNEMGESEMASLLEECIFQDDAAILIEAANAAGGQDNITAVMMYLDCGR